MQDGERGEGVLAAREIGRGASADREARNEDERLIDTNARKRPHLAQAAHDMAVVLRGAAGTVFDQPDAGHARGVRRDHDELLPLSEIAQAQKDVGALPTGPVKHDEERQSARLGVVREIICALPAGGGDNPERAGDAGPRAVVRAGPHRRHRGHCGGEAREERGGEVSRPNRYFSRVGYTTMKFDWLGMFTFGNVCAFISSLSPTIPLRLSKYAVSAYTSSLLRDCGWM